MFPALWGQKTYSFCAVDLQSGLIVYEKQNWYPQILLSSTAPIIFQLVHQILQILILPLPTISHLYVFQMINRFRTGKFLLGHLFQPLTKYRHSNVFIECTQLSNSLLLQGPIETQRWLTSLSCSLLLVHTELIFTWLLSTFWLWCMRRAGVDVFVDPFGERFNTRDLLGHQIQSHKTAEDRIWCHSKPPSVLYSCNHAFHDQVIPLPVSSHWQESSLNTQHEFCISFPQTTAPCLFLCLNTQLSYPLVFVMVFEGNLYCSVPSFLVSLPSER